jgi:diguanylate cyclase (GGDEF)-like protein
VRRLRHTTAALSRTRRPGAPPPRDRCRWSGRVFPLPIDRPSIAATAGATAALALLAGTCSAAHPRGLLTLLTLAGVTVLARRCREHADARRDLEHLAGTDALTGLSNRRRLVASLRAPARHDRVVVLLDLDGFKAYNDRFGHLAGDDVLVRCGDALREAVAGRGEAFRLGGDELCVVLDDASAITPAELAGVVARAAGGFGLSASAGSAILRAGTSGERAVLAAADARLYAAKARRGRRPRMAVPV